jgi:hypothetical membrane protein
VNVRNWRSAALRWLSLCGIVVPPLIGAVYALVGVRDPHYSFLHDYMSDLAALGREEGHLLSASWVAFAVLFGPFAAAVYAGLHGHRLGGIPPTLLALFALFVGLCGLIRHDPFGAGNRAHVLVSGLANVALFPAPFFLWLATRADNSWRRFRRFSLFLQGTGAAAGLWLLLVYYRRFDWGGLAEWGYYCVYYVWVAALALRLRRMSSAALEHGRA